MGFLEKRPIFVPFVLPGERVAVKIRRRHSQYLEADLVEVMEASPERIDPPCPYFGRCGGCQWQQMKYETQLEWKQKIVEESLQERAKIENPKVLPTIPSPKIFGWRSRVTFHGDANGKIGFYEPESYRVVDIENCLIADATVNEELKRLRTMDRRPWTKKDYEVRSGAMQGFTQVNPEQNENLKILLKEWALDLPHETVVELFCGSGNFTEVLIPMAKKIIAVDCDRTAIDQATSAHQHINTSAQFICSDAIRYFAQIKWEEPLDLLVLDPPRDGAAGAVEGVMKSRPKNILYISCNPDTLARDIKYLKDFAGYEFVQTQPIDMFPMSHHIESLSWIRRSP